MAVATDERAAHEADRAAARSRSQRRVSAGQDIGPIPPIENPARRAEASGSLRRWCEIYHPERFSLAWSPDHLQALTRMDGAIRHGGQYALAMSRGSGKTSIAEVACEYATMNAWHLFVMLLAVSAEKAKQILESIKMELATNELLAADFPEVCYPIHALEDRANRAKGQHCGGEKTWIKWSTTEIVFPTIAGSKASGAILRVAGITSGGIRGAKFTRPSDGSVGRPSLVLLDDPQDDKVARSPVQVERRHRTINGAVLGMAGPGKAITAIAAVTVIEKADLADRLLDRQQSPQWTGQRYQMLYEEPARKDLWDEYATRRRDELRNDGDGHLATAWYGQQRAEMDRGARVAWPERHRPDELSALQHAMNLRIDLGERAFAAEYQNDPMPEEELAGQLDAATIAVRTNGLERGAVPLAASHLTAYIDVQKQILFWLVAAWSDDFTGAVVDYGTYPDQQRRYFTLSEVQRTLGRAAPGAGLEGSIHAGLGKCADLLLGRAWKREDGAEMKVEKLLVDANWGASTDTVYAWCRGTPHAALVMPSHGRYVGASSKPWSEYEKKPGQRLGFHWLVPVAQGKRAVRHLLIDVNFWKTFVAERLMQAVGDRGALTLPGKPGTDHKMLSEQLTSEYRVRTEGRGRAVDEWKLRPDRPDNHWFDCLVGCAAAASLQGVALAEAQAAAKPKKRQSWREVYEAQKAKERGSRVA